MKEDATTPIGIATNVVIIHSNFHTSYQQVNSLSPDNWLYNSKDEKIVEKIMNYEKELNEVFRNYRYHYQNDILKELLSEVQFDNNDRICDNISISLNLDNMLDSKNKLVCPKCSSVTDDSLDNCCFCHYGFKNFLNRKDLYGDVPNGHPEKPPEIELGEVIDCNPNSYKAIYDVLESLIKQGGVGELRKWIHIGFDGVPLRMAWELITSIYQCKKCKEIFDFLDIPLEEHSKEKHPDETFAKEDFELYFGKLLLAVGAGHMEKNILLAVMQLTKLIFMDTVCDKLGFKSENAKNFVTNVGDHHVSWQMFSIFLESFAKELVLPYIVSSHQKGQSPSIIDFYDWQKDIKNPNYNFFYDLVFNVMLGFKCARSGARRNSSQHLIAGRQKACKFMFLNRHDIYRPIIAHDMKMRVLAPDQIKDYISQNETFSRSGDSYRGEGGDYITETENKHLKSNLPPGVPTF